MKTTKIFNILILSVLLCSISAKAQSTFQEKEQSAEQQIQTIMEKLNVIGLATVVVKDGEIIYDNSFGYKSVDERGNNHEKLANNDLFRIASISKTFVATAIFQLIEKGELNLEDDCNKYLDFEVSNPKFPDVPITIKMLLSHRSSINDSQSYYSFNNINPVKNANSSLSYNDYAPGEGYNYCNFNYNLLGAVIEKVSNERFDDYIEKHITKQLGLNASFNVNRLDSNLFVSIYRVDSLKNTKLERDAYKPYTWHMNNYKMGEFTPLLVPAGGMKISATDLAKYMMMHMNKGEYGSKRIIAAQSEMSMRNVVTAETKYALSFREYTNLIPDHIMYGQTGGAYGFRGAMIFSPDERFGFIVLTNGSSSTAIDGYQDMHKPIINVLYNSFIKEDNIQ